MVSRGKMNPEKKTLGNRNTIDICRACIWFSALVPTSNPRLSSAKTYTSVEKIRRSHRRVVKHLRPDIDWHSLPSSIAHQRFHRLRQRHTESGLKSLQCRGGIGSVNKQFHLCRM